MRTKREKAFDTIEFFRKVKQTLAKRMEGMNLSEQKEFMKRLREGEIKIKV